MNDPRHSVQLARFVLPVALAAAANADVLILEAPELGAIQDPQLAVDLAPEGATLVFAREDIPGFTIDGKSLTLTGPGADLMQVVGTVEIRNLSPEQNVRMHGMTVRGVAGVPTFDQQALLLADCEGPVRLSSCTFTGGDISSDALNGIPGLVIRDCDDVAVLDCEAQGSAGLYDSQAGTGGAGIDAKNSVLAIYDSLVLGGSGGDSDFAAGDAASALISDQTRLFAAGTEFRGGDGGDAEDPVFECCGGNGGDGVAAIGLPRPRLLDCSYLPGTGGDSFWGTPGVDGAQRSWDLGTLNPLPGANRGLQITENVVATNGTLTVALEGLAGDRFFIGASMADGRSQPLGPAGVRFLPSPVVLPTLPQATLVSDGSTKITLPAPPAGFPGHATWILQAFVKDAQGQTFFSGAALVTSLRPDGVPDCDANGIWDLVDIMTAANLVDCDGNLELDGCQTLPDCNRNGISDDLEIACMSEPDLNGNGIPDTCDFQDQIFVDANAAPGGDGTFGDPFSNLADAVGAAVFGEEIVLFDGVYTGPNNRGLDTNGRGLSFLGQGGAQACIIDLQGAGRFLTASQSTLTATLRGLQIINGFAQEGGAVDSNNQRLVIEDCIFTDNEATIRGGALNTTAPITVRSSQFLRNKTLSDPSAPQPTGGAMRIANNSLVSDCVFDFNESSNGGAIGVLLNFNSVASAPSITHCVFRSNTARQAGGAIHSFGGVLHSASTKSAVIDNCFFGFNTAETAGGAFYFDKALGSQDLPKVRLAHCTFTLNSVLQGLGSMAGGGGMYVGRSADLELVSSIVWGNTSTLGAQVRVMGDPSRPASLLVRSSAVEGGQAGIDTVSGTVDFDASNVTSDPLFMGSPSDFRLGAGSPCIDTVDSSLLSEDLGDIDGNGNTFEDVPLDLLGATRRVDDPTVPDVGGSTPPVSDMGCFERQP